MLFHGVSGSCCVTASLLLPGHLTPLGRASFSLVLLILSSPVWGFVGGAVVFMHNKNKNKRQGWWQPKVPSVTWVTQEGSGNRVLQQRAQRAEPPEAELALRGGMRGGNPSQRPPGSSSGRTQWQLLLWETWRANTSPGVGWWESSSWRTGQIMTVTPVSWLSCWKSAGTSRVETLSRCAAQAESACGG